MKELRLRRIPRLAFHPFLCFWSWFSFSYACVAVAQKQPLAGKPMDLAVFGLTLLTEQMEHLHAGVRQPCSRAAILTLFGLRALLCSSKLLKTPKNFCLWGLYLLLFITFKFKTEKFKNYFLIHLKTTIILHINISDNFLKRNNYFLKQM